MRVLVLLVILVVSQACDVPFRKFLDTWIHVRKEAILQQTHRYDRGPDSLALYLKITGRSELRFKHELFSVTQISSEASEWTLPLTREQFLEKIPNGFVEECMSAKNFAKLFDLVDAEALKAGQGIVERVKLNCRCPEIDPSVWKENNACKDGSPIFDKSIPVLELNCIQPDIFGNFRHYVGVCRDMGGSRGFVVPDAAYCSGLVCSERITNGVVTKKFERLLNRVVLPPSERDLLFKQFVKNLKTFGTSATGWNLSPYQFQMDHQDPEFSRSLVEEYHVLFGGTKRISLGQYLWRKDIHGEYRQNDPVIVSDEGIVIPLERMKVPGNDPRKKKGARQEDWKVEPVTEETRKVNHVPHMCPREVILLDVEEVEKHKNHPQHYTVHMAEKEIHVLLPFCQVECTHGNAVADTSSWPWVRDIFPEKEILEEREPKNKYFSMTRKIKCNYIPNEGFVYEPPTHPRCEDDMCWGEGNPVSIPVPWEYDESGFMVPLAAHPPVQFDRRLGVTGNHDAYCASFFEGKCPGAPKSKGEEWTTQQFPLNTAKPITRKQLLEAGYSAEYEEGTMRFRYLGHESGLVITADKLENDLRQKLYDKLPPNVHWDTFDDDVFFLTKPFGKCSAPPASPPLPPDPYDAEERPAMPIPFPQPASNHTTEPPMTSIQRNMLLQSLFLAPWPATKEHWSQDRQVPASVFPAMQINCDELNKDTSLSKDKNVVFMYNPDFDPSKDPWEEGGACRAAKKKKKPVKAVVPAKSVSKAAPVAQVQMRAPPQNSSATEILLPFPKPKVVPQKCLDNVVGGTYFDGQAAFGIVGGSLKMRVSEGGTSLHTMDAAGALNHVFMSTGGTSEWADVLNGGLLCSDSHTPLRGISVPGGDLGEFLALVSAIDRTVSIKEIVLWSLHMDSESHNSTRSEHILSHGAILRLLVEFLISGHTRAFHWSMDRRMMNNVCRTTGWCPSDLRSLLQPPPQMVPSLIELMQQPQYVGSRYLRAILLHPDKFLINVDLVRGVLKAVYSLLWRDESTLFLPSSALSYIREKLVPTISIKPPSEASGVILVGSGDCPSGIYPTLAQLSEIGSQTVMVYEDAAQVYRLHLAAFVMGLRGFDGRLSTALVLQDRIHQIATASWRAFSSLYLYSLSTFCVHYEAPDGGKCQFHSPFPATTDSQVESGQYVADGDYRVIRNPSDELVKPTASLSHSSMAPSEVHHLLSSQSQKWQPILRSTSIGSVDGRHIEPTMAIMGSDVGQFVLAIAAIEASRDDTFTDDTIHHLLSKYLRFQQRPVFTMYLDVDALSFLCRNGLFCPAVNVNDKLDSNQRITLAIRSLSNRTPIQGEELIPFVARPEAVGDRFIRFLLTTQASIIRKEVVTAVIVAYYRILWGLDADGHSIDDQGHSVIASMLDLVALPGNAGEERAVVLLSHGRGAPQGQAPVLSPSLQGQKIFLHDQTASKSLRTHFLEMLATETGTKANDSFAKLRILCNQIEQSVLQSFWTEVASDIPVYFASVQ